MNKLRSFILLLSIFSTTVFSQEEIGIDSLFQLSRKAAFSGERELAILLCDSLIKQSPDYWDAWVLKGRVLAWEKEYSKARSLFVELRAKKISRDIYYASIDVEIWSKNYEEGIRLIDMGLTKYQNDSTMLFKKAKAYFSVQKYDESLAAIEQVLLINETNQEAISLKLKIADLLEENINKEIDSSKKEIPAKSLFEQSREAAFSGNRNLALILCDSIIKTSPENWDAWVLKGRILTWEKKYRKGRDWFDSLRIKKISRDIYDASVNLEMWSKNYKAGLKLLDEALLEYPDDSTFLFKKAKIYYSLEDYEQALLYVNKVLELNSQNKEAIELKQKLLALLSKNHIGVHANYDHFAAVYTPITRLSFDYKRATKIGSLIPRINFVSRFGTIGHQFELDYYPKLKHHWSMYLSYGYSQSRLFPSHRAGFELYRGLGNGYDMSAGFRYLRFSHNVMIYTGSVSKYLGNYLFTLRPFITPKTGSEASVSLHFTARKYLNDDLDYFEAEIAGGRRPDANQLLAEEIPLEIYYYRSGQFRLRYINIFKSRNEINFQAGLERFELPFRASDFTWNFFYGISYKYNF